MYFKDGISRSYNNFNFRCKIDIISLQCFNKIFPKLKLKKSIKYLTITAICFGYFLCGIIFCLQSGTYWIEIFNSYAGDWVSSDFIANLWQNYL